MLPGLAPLRRLRPTRRVWHPRPVAPPPFDIANRHLALLAIALAVANVLLSVALERDGESKTAGAAMLAAISAVKRTERSGDAATVRAAVDAACL